MVGGEQVDKRTRPWMLGIGDGPSDQPALADQAGMQALDVPLQER